MSMINLVKEIFSITEKHHAWRSSCLNMIASESLTSPFVEVLLSSDFSRRYSSKGAYAGDRYYLGIEEIVKDLARRAYRAKYVELRPATGNLTVMGVVFGLTKPGETVTQYNPQWGGYPIRMLSWSGIDVVFYPFDHNTLNIDAEGAQQLIREHRPSLVVVGASEFLFPHPLAALSQAAREVGASVYYDGSHVMGLILGGQFQDPFGEGADVVAGSTHKTIFGSQRGVIATNNEELYNRIANVFDSPPFLVSCYHLNTLVALGVALAEMLEFGSAYATQIVRNAQTLAQVLAGRGLKLYGVGHGFTQSHQVILDCGTFGSPEAVDIKNRLEEVGIIADQVVRFGVQELTRLGMKENEMRHIAGLIADTVHQGRPMQAIRNDVCGLTAAFQKVHYSFCDGEQAYAFLGADMAKLLV